MEFLRTLLSLLDTKRAVPALYGPFHVFFIVTSIFCGFLISRHGANKGEAFMRRFLLIEALLITVLEIYKQINFSFHVDGSQILFDYQWYAFPFQFCSTPMYIGLLAAVVKRKSLHEHLCSYLATYALFAGICDHGSVTYHRLDVDSNGVDEDSDRIDHNTDTCKQCVSRQIRAKMFMQRFSSENCSKQTYVHGR